MYYNFPFHYCAFDLHILCQTFLLHSQRLLSFWAFFIIPLVFINACFIYVAADYLSNLFFFLIFIVFLSLFYASSSILTDGCLSLSFQYNERYTKKWLVYNTFNNFSTGTSKIPKHPMGLLSNKIESEQCKEMLLQMTKCSETEIWL